MASRFRPKGSYKDYLDLSASQISAMSESELRGIVNKLNDAANKRVRRLEESGYSELSPSYKGRQKAGRTFFRLTGRESKKDLKTAYLESSNFLRPGGTSTKKGVEAHNEKFSELYREVLGRDFNDPRNFDRRYKKKKILRKSVKERIRAFWEKYDQWREVQKDKNPDSARGDTNINNVESFEEELFDSGKVTYKDMEEAAEKKYLEDEATRRALEEDSENEQASAAVQPARADRQGSSKAKQAKHKGKGKGKKFAPKFRFEKIKIF